MIPHRSSGKLGFFARLIQRPSLNDKLSIVAYMGAMLFDLLVMVLLTNYVEAVFPGSDGVPERPFFFLSVCLLFREHIRESV